MMYFNVAFRFNSNIVWQIMVKAYGESDALEKAAKAYSISEFGMVILTADIRRVTL